MEIEEVITYIKEGLSEKKSYSIELSVEMERAILGWLEELRERQHIEWRRKLTGKRYGDATYEEIKKKEAEIREGVRKFGGDTSFIDYNVALATFGGFDDNC